jgi:peptidoglycan/xylan/chitin deacetylase (PgdA/CDA1 family)
MIIERPLTYLSLFYYGAIWRINKKERAIYLTFDDGPTPEITPAVLDILDKYEVKATFFCIGKNVENHPDIYQEVLRRGHKVGNHTYCHLKGFNSGVSSYLNNVEKTSKVITSNLFRPPYGRIRPSQLRVLSKKYKIILWDLVTRDYNAQLSPEFILKNIYKMSRNGSVVVFHDSVKAQKNLLAVLPEAIEFWQKEGYQLKTID